MKKVLLLIIILVMPIMVYAEDYSVKTLIPVDTKASVKTEKFDYTNFVYNSRVDEKGNSLITFESIKNNASIGKTPISINILLFGEDQKNIGFVTYCTDKDLDSNYSGYKLPGNTSVSFSINVVSKYFVEGKSTKDVKYISVLDENEYCQIGGYDKYKDLTLDQIVNGATTKKDVNGVTKFINELQEKGLMPLIIFGLVGLAVLVIVLMVLSSIFKKIKENRLNRPKEVKIDVPMEETVDLKYEEVKDDNLNEDGPISMGEVKEETLDDDNDENKEDGSDLTKFFN